MVKNLRDKIVFIFKKKKDNKIKKDYERISKVYNSCTFNKEVYKKTLK